MTPPASPAPAPAATGAPVPGSTAPAPAFSIGGRIPIVHRVFAAPMCGASKLPYRRMARRYGADIAYTEMVKAYPLVKGDPKTLVLLHTTPDEAPCGPQICGGDADVMRRAAVRLEQMGFPLVDINMGCPVRRVVAEGAGAALLREPRRVEEVVRACVGAVSIPVTVKIRSGWGHQGHADAATLARAVEAGGAALVCIHGRAREQFHGGDVDLESMRAAKAAVRIPVVGNGGIHTAEDALRMVRETGCDAVMIGRGAHGKPWLFRDVARALAGAPPLPPPSRVDACDLIEEHLDGTLGLIGERGVLLFRKYAAWYFRDAPYGACFRDRAYRLRDAQAMRDLLAAWRDNLRACEGAAARGVEPPVPPGFEGADPRETAPEPCDAEEAE